MLNRLVNDPVAVDGCCMAIDTVELYDWGKTKKAMARATTRMRRKD